MFSGFLLKLISSYRNIRTKITKVICVDSSFQVMVFFKWALRQQCYKTKLLAATCTTIADNDIYNNNEVYVVTCCPYFSCSLIGPLYIRTC